MDRERKKLAKAPIDVALFQMKFDIGSSTLADFTRHDAELRRYFPNRKDTFSAEINFPGSSIPLGISQVTGTSKAKVSGYLYLSQDQKSKIELSEDTFTYVEEHPYNTWDEFVSNILKYLKVLKPAFDNHIITRISIRFINRFVISDFTNPLDYFKTTISASEPSAVPYPVSKYAFSMMLPVNDSTYSIVKQDFNVISDKVNYIFDIDVLSRSNIIFDMEIISETLSELREIKNDIFFGNVTEKLIELCN